MEEAIGGGVLTLIFTEAGGWGGSWLGRKMFEVFPLLADFFWLDYSGPWGEGGGGGAKKFSHTLFHIHQKG